MLMLMQLDGVVLLMKMEEVFQIQMMYQVVLDYNVDGMLVIILVVVNQLQE
jgi:hypothetical protein